MKTYKCAIRCGGIPCILQVPMCAADVEPQHCVYGIDLKSDWKEEKEDE